MTDTDADYALEEIFRRDEALKGGAGKPPKHPEESAKKPEAVKKAEDEAFKSFIYAKPDWKEKKAALEEAKATTAEKVKEEGIASVYERTGQFKGGKPPTSDAVRPVATALPPAAIKLLDEAYKDLVAGRGEEYKRKMAEVDVILKANLTEKGIAGVYAPVKVAPLKAGVTRRNTSTGGDIVTGLLTIRNQVKLYHWQTGSFARHKATDDLTAALDLAIDNFVEVYMGRYGRPKVSKTIKLSNYSEAEAQRFVSKQRKFLTDVLPRKIKKTDTDLLNIRDEILAELNKVLYLFTLQ
jgi:hypothetical protein